VSDGDAADVLAALAARGESLAVAESLTGGLLGAALVDVPGASRSFRGGLIVYATDLKSKLAGVPEDLLAARGPVDGAVAAALAEGARQRCAADWGAATTGVAGPGPSDGAPAGTVWVAVAGPRTAQARRLALTGDRGEIRSATVAAALRLLADLVCGTPAGDGSTVRP
jgi:nicotinamide-nucleotide amidase